MFKCKACGLVLNERPERCPKCNAVEFIELNEEEVKKQLTSEDTNVLLAKLVKSAAKLQKNCQKGIDINLDPTCMMTFTKAKELAYLVEQMAKSELVAHASKGKL